MGEGATLGTPMRRLPKDVRQRCFVHLNLSCARSVEHFLAKNAFRSNNYGFVQEWLVPPNLVVSLLILAMNLDGAGMYHHGELKKPIYCTMGPQ